MSAPEHPELSAEPAVLQRWHHAARAQGLNLRGWRTPVRGKPLIHFLHGNGFCGRTYDPMLRLLAEHFDLWLTDIQGHGDSDPGRRFLGWNANAELALACFQAYSADYGTVPRYAVGHSFGGVLTALICAQADQPFTRAVLLDPVLFPPAMLTTIKLVEHTGTGKLTPLARAALRRRSHWPNRQHAYAALHGRGTYQGWDEPALRAFIDHALRDNDDGSVSLKCAPRLEATIFSSSPRKLWPSIRKIPIPTLLAHGDDTFPFVKVGAQRAQRLNSNIRVDCVSGSHCFMQQQPAAAATLVHDFLRPQVTSSL